MINEFVYMRDVTGQIYYVLEGRKADKVYLISFSDNKFFRYFQTCWLKHMINGFVYMRDVTGQFHYRPAGKESKYIMYTHAFFQLFKACGLKTNDEPLCLHA